MIRCFHIAIFFHFLLSSVLIVAQEKANNVGSEKEVILIKRTSLGTSGYLNRSGLYVGISGSTQLSRSVLMNVDVSMNIRKAALNSFNPLIGLGFGYECAKNRSKFSFAPGIKVQLSSLRLNNDNKVTNSDGLIGYALEAGDRIRLMHSLYAGIGYEESSNFSLFYASYILQLGIGYRF